MDKDLIDEVEDTMFKKGDRVRCIREFSNGRMHTHGALNEIYVVKVDQESSGSVNIENLGLLSSNRFELVTSELDELIETALNGYKALQKLNKEYKGQFKHTNQSGIEFRDIVYNNLHKIKLEKVEIPKFEPFTVRSNWKVELDGATLKVGCQKFDASDLYKSLDAMCRCNAQKCVNENYTLTASRRGVEYSLHFITWEDAEKILEALKKAGF